MLYVINIYCYTAHCVTVVNHLVVMHHSTVNKTVSVRTSTLNAWKNN